MIDQRQTAIASPAYNTPVKYLRVILIFLLLGVIVNLAFAVGFALIAEYSPPSIRGQRTIGPPYKRQVQTQTQFGRTYFTSFRQPGEFGNSISTIAPHWSVLHHGTTYYFDNNLACTFELATGWPWRSMKAAYTHTRTRLRDCDILYGIEITSRSRVPSYVRLLPTRPIAAGFAMNSVFLGGAFWLFLFAFRWGRSAVWMLQNRCPWCGYDLRGADHEACPECGKEIRKANPA